MTSVNEPTRSRLRRERRKAATARRAESQAVPKPAPAPVPTPPADHPAPSARRERGLGDIAGAGPSQLGVSQAARARDVNRPSDEDLAAAERDVVIVRRNWTPPPAT